MLNGDIQVFVGPRFFSKQCINSPPAINPNHNASLLKLSAQFNDVPLTHHAQTIPTRFVVSY